RRPNNAPCASDGAPGSRGSSSRPRSRRHSAVSPWRGPVPRGPLFLRLFGLGAAATLAEIVDVQRLDKLLEDRQLLFVDGCGVFFRPTGFTLRLLTFKN